jgi:hypothetical protein
MAGLADLFASVFGAPKPPEPDRLPPLARGRFTPPVEGSVIPPQTPAPTSRLPTADDPRLAGYDLRTLIDVANETAEPWSKTTGDRTRYMKEAFSGYDPKTSNYTGTDPEGRKLDSVFHAGTLQGGVNAPISTDDVGGLARIMSTVKTPGGSFMALGRTDRGNQPEYQGVTKYSKVPDAQYRPLGMEISVPEAGPWVQSPQEIEATKRHETGHALARRMYPGNTPESVEAMLEASKYGGDRAGALAQMREFAQPRLVQQTGGKANSPMGKYIMSGPELWAENMDAYMANPNDYKAQFPAAAAALRHMINTNPNVNKYLTLSKNDLGRTLASGVG